MPLVVVPLAFEQGAIGARIERCGAGLVIRPRRLTVRRLCEALDSVRTDPGFRRNAGSLAGDIAVAGGASRAADLIEAALTPAVRPPVLSMG